MLKIVIDLCSSPEPSTKLLPTQRQPLTNTEESIFNPDPVVPDWYDISSESSEHGRDNQCSNVKIDLLPEIPPITNNCNPPIAQNDIIHLLSDEDESVSFVEPSVVESLLITEPSFEANRKPKNSNSSTVNHLSDPEKLIHAGSANKLDNSELSDPFASSPFIRRRVSSSSDTYHSQLSPNIQNASAVLVSETKTMFEEGIFEESENRSIADNSKGISSDDSESSLSQSLSFDFTSTNDKLEKTLNVTVTESDSDEAWIEELLEEIKNKKSRAKDSGTKAGSDVRQRKKVPIINEAIEKKNHVLSVPCFKSDSDRPSSGIQRDTIEHENIRKSRERLQQKEEKVKLKEAEKFRKIREKEEISRKKKSLALLGQINKLKSRLQSTTEMIVDLPSSMEEELALQVRLFLDGVKARYSTFECSSNVIKWRRKVQAIWDPVKDQWMPITEQIKDEKHVMCVLSSKDLVKLIKGMEGHDLNAYVLKLTVDFSGKKIIFLIEGLDSWLAKNKAVKNKEFTDRVRSQITGHGPSRNVGRKARKKPDQSEYIEKSMVDDALLRLHVVHEVLIHHTATPLETAECIMRFTQHISTIPYRNQLENINTSNFCMENGQIDSGKDAKHTYIQMLQQIHLVTPAVAWGIESKYKNVQALIRGLEEEGSLALERCRKCSNKNGAFTDTKIGQATSRRVHSVFLGQNAWSAEI